MDESLAEVVAGEASCPINTLIVKSHLFVSKPVVVAKSSATSGGQVRAPLSNVSIGPITRTFVDGQVSKAKQKKADDCLPETQARTLPRSHAHTHTPSHERCCSAVVYSCGLSWLFFVLVFSQCWLDFVVVIAVLPCRLALSSV